MSRTYRTHLEWRKLAHGRYWTWEEEQAYHRENGIPRYVSLGWNGRYYVEKWARDRKPWDKPPKWFKQQNRRWERSKVSHAVRTGQEPPEFRRGDQYEWT